MLDLSGSLLDLSGYVQSAGLRLCTAPEMGTLGRARSHAAPLHVFRCDCLRVRQRASLASSRFRSEHARLPPLEKNAEPGVLPPGFEPGTSRFASARHTTRPIFEGVQILGQAAHTTTKETTIQERQHSISKRTFPRTHPPQK